MNVHGTYIHMYVHVCTCTFIHVHEFINYIAEHVSPRIAGRWDVQGAWCNRYYVEQQAFQRERLRITSFLVCDLLDYVVRTRISIIRRPILMITQFGLLMYVVTTPHHTTQKSTGFTNYSSVSTCLSTTVVSLVLPLDHQLPNRSLEENVELVSANRKSLRTFHRIHFDTIQSHARLWVTNAKTTWVH